MGGALVSADPSDPTVRNCGVAAKGRLAGAIDDGAAANNDVVHANLPKSASSSRRSRGALSLKASSFDRTTGRGRCITPSHCFGATRSLFDHLVGTQHDRLRYDQT